MTMSRWITVAVIVPAIVLLTGPTAWAQQDKYQESKPRSEVEALEAARDLRQRGDHTSATRRLEALVQRDPDYYRALLNLGLAHAESGALDEALAAFDRALAVKRRHDIRDATIYNSIGWTHMLTGDYEAAIPYLERAVSSEEPATEATRRRAHNNLGLAYLYAGRVDQAEAQLQKANEMFGGELAARNLELVAAVKRARRE